MTVPALARSILANRRTRAGGLGGLAAARWSLLIRRWAGRAPPELVAGLLARMSRDPFVVLQLGHDRVSAKKYPISSNAGTHGGWLRPHPQRALKGGPLKVFAADRAAQVPLLSHRQPVSRRSCDFAGVFSPIVDGCRC